MQWMLPGTSRRTVRDWFVDVTMFVLALAASAYVVGDTSAQHTDLGWLVDIALGIPCLAAMWWRRRHPVGLGAFVLAASSVSAFAAGPSLFFIFNAAIRAPRRALGWLVGLAVVSTAIFPLLYPGRQEGWLFQVVFGTLIVAIAVGWGLFVRARRELEQSLRERAERLEAEQWLRVEQARDAERRRI